MDADDVERAVGAPLALMAWLGPETADALGYDDPWPAHRATVTFIQPTHVEGDAS